MALLQYKLTMITVRLKTKMVAGFIDCARITNTVPLTSGTGVTFFFRRISLVDVGHIIPKPDVFNVYSSHENEVCRVKITSLISIKSFL